MKDWSVSAFFPELRPAHLAEQQVKVRASSLRAAIGFALDRIRERDGMKGKKITTARITVRLIDGTAARER
jgi:hypothetical protein